MKDSDLINILNRFAITSGVYEFLPIYQGYINDTYRVSRKGEHLYILQRINTVVFQEVDHIMENIEKSLTSLQDPEYAFIEIIKTKDGQLVLNHENTCWRLLSYISESKAYDTCPNETVAFEAGKLIGKFHLCLNKAKVSDFHITIPEFHDINFRARQFMDAKTNASEDKLQSADHLLQFVENMIAKLMAVDLSELPLRICHNDTKLNNILFSMETGKALCLIDLDTIMPGYFMYDFGDAIRIVANTAREDEQDVTKIKFNKTMFEAFVEGLKNNSAFLTSKEIKTLAYGVVIMPFLHGLRALTDFLNGNVYYKVTYENQNLDRAASLFEFSKKSFEQLDYMQEFVVTALSQKFSG
jgi:Ser/Thr protein kinase RdoA (MazF antagonist)